jgi:hypothetical protein
VAHSTTACITAKCKCWTQLTIDDATATATATATAIARRSWRWRRGGRSGARREDPLQWFIRLRLLVCRLVGVCAGSRPSGPGRTLIHLHRLTCSQHVSRPWPSMCRLIKYLIIIPLSFRPSHLVSSPLLISSPISRLPAPSSLCRTSLPGSVSPLHPLLLLLLLCHSGYYCLSLSILHITAARVSPTTPARCHHPPASCSVAPLDSAHGRHSTLTPSTSACVALIPPA